MITLQSNSEPVIIRYSSILNKSQIQALIQLINSANLISLPEGIDWTNARHLNINILPTEIGNIDVGFEVTLPISTSNTEAVQTPIETTSSISEGGENNI